jgi:hypothetical protein
MRPHLVKTPDTSQLTPAPQDDLDRLLAEYDAGVPKQSEANPEPATDGLTKPTDAPVHQSLDQLLALSTDPRISQLEGELAGVRSEAEQLRAEAHRQQEWAAFQEYASDLQKRMPEWVPDGYAELKLKALAHDPTIAAAFDYRNVDRAAANLELQKVQAALAHLQSNPTALALLQQSNPTRVQELQQYANKLNIAVNSAAILRKATLDIIREAEKLPPPIDPDATAWRNEISWAVKSASAKRIAEPPPAFGRMTDNEFRDWKRNNLGWE